MQPLAVVPVKQNVVHPSQNPAVAIHVFSDYIAVRKRVLVSAYKAHPAGGLATWQGEIVERETMTRLNKKKLAQLQETAKAEVRDRSGMAWDLVKHICEKNGLTILD